MRTPCFTSHSPRSCRCDFQSRYSARSSAARLERRICPASPQSITRWAILIPAPATLERSFTSNNPLTGPLWIPIRSWSSGEFLKARLISSAHCTGASGLLKKTRAIPSPDGSLTSFPSASAARNSFVFRTTSLSCRCNSRCSSLNNFE